MDDHATRQLVGSSRAMRDLPTVIRMLVPWWVLVWAGCSGPTTRDTRSPSALPFETAFTLEDRVHLAEAEDDPIGNITALVQWGDRIAVVDHIQANVKVFDGHGRLWMTLGRAGDGPGEFRHPAAATVIEGRLAVFDGARGVVTEFSPDGERVADWRLSATRLGSMLAAGDGSAVLLTGRLPHGHPPGVDQAVTAAHLVERDGAVTRSFGQYARPREPYQGHFDRAFAVPVASGFVMMREHSNVVGRWGLDVAQPPTFFAVWEEGYEPPDWPGRRASRDELRWLMSWANRQTWVLGLIPVDGSRFIVRFGVVDPRSSERASVYVLADTAGATVWATLPTHVIIGSTARCRVLAASRREDGAVEANVYRMRTGDCGARR